MKFTRLFACAALSSALVAGAAPGGATPSGSHVISGSGIAAPNTVLALSASEATQTGTALINLNPVTISCVNVQAWAAPATHLVTMLATETSGIQWVLTIRESSGIQTLLVSQTVTSLPCGGGAAGTFGPGTFVITP